MGSYKRRNRVVSRHLMAVALCLLAVLAVLAGCGRSTSSSAGQYGGATVGQAPSAAGDQSKVQTLTDQGQACWERQDNVGAIQAYQAGLKIDPNNSDLKRRLAINYNVLGVKWYNAGDRGKALQYFKTAVAYDPANPNAQKNIDAMNGPGDSAPRRLPHMRAVVEQERRSTATTIITCSRSRATKSTATTIMNCSQSRGHCRIA